MGQYGFATFCSFTVERRQSQPKSRNGLPPLVVYPRRLIQYINSYPFGRLRGDHHPWEPENLGRISDCVTYSLNVRSTKVSVRNYTQLGLPNSVFCWTQMCLKNLPGKDERAMVKSVRPNASNFIGTSLEKFLWYAINLHKLIKAGSQLITC